VKTGGNDMEKGEIVTVYNSTIGGEEIIEGRAKLIKPSDIDNTGLNEGWERWLVEFIDQPKEYFDRVIKVC
jgi:hypothetical protein